MLPKNVRQIGFIEGNKKIYIEDYVMTYARKIDGMAILLGKMEKEEDDTIFYINGAVFVRDMDMPHPILLSNEDWSAIYADVKQYFSESEIMGWLLARRDVILEIDEEIRKIHEENFKGTNKILFLYDKGENEEAFYIAGILGDLKKQSGFYIYYEKNEAMQNYMIDKTPEIKVEESRPDDAMEKVREIIAQKEPPKGEKKMINLMYGASTLLAAVILVIGATMLDNYDKMRNMEQTLNQISDTLVDEGPGDETVQVDKIIGNTGKSGGEENKQNIPEIGAGTPTPDPAPAEEIPEDDGAEKAGEQVSAEEQKEDDKKKENQEKEDNQEETSEEKKEDGEKQSGSAEKPDGKKEEKEKKISEPVSANTRQYIVKDGDTLASISLKFYDSYAYIEKIQEANEIEDGDKILSGQTLVLPEK